MRGTVVPLENMFFPRFGKKGRTFQISLRIHVGNGVCVVRPVEKCRRVEMELPIDIVPGTEPPKFKWRMKVDTIAGVHTQVIEGRLQAGMDIAVAELIALTKRQDKEISTLKARLECASEVVAEQNKRSSPPAAPVVQGQRQHKGK